MKTVMNHPRQGKTQMFRRNLSEKQFQRVLSDPRSHTGMRAAGYWHAGVNLAAGASSALAASGFSSTVPCMPLL